MATSKCVIIVIAIFATAAMNSVGAGVGTRLPSPSEILAELLEDFRDQMHEGIPSLGVPVMEPLTLGHVDIDLEHEIGQFNGTMDNVVIENLSAFESKEVTLLVNFRFKFDLNIPMMVMTGDYDIDGNIGDLFPLFGRGPFRLEMSDMRMLITGSMTFSINNGFSIGQFQYIQSMSEMKAQFDGLLGGGELEELFNKIISQLGPEALDVLWPEIAPGIEAKIVNGINSQLSSVTDIIWDIINGIKP